MILDYGLHSLRAFANTRLLFKKKKGEVSFTDTEQYKQMQCCSLDSV